MVHFRVLLFFVALYPLSLTSCSGLSEDTGSSRSNNGGDETAGVAAGSGGGGSIAVVDSGIDTLQGGASGSAQNADTGGVGGTTQNADVGPADSSIVDAGGRESGAADAQTDSAHQQGPTQNAAPANGFLLTHRQHDRLTHGSARLKGDQNLFPGQPTK